MATIKAFTSLEQGKKLAEILPLESADMHWQEASKEYENPYGIYDRYFRLVAGNSSKIINNKRDFRKGFILPAWSLSALLGVLPNKKHISTTLSRGGWRIEPVEYIDKWFCEYEDEVDEDSPCKGFTVSADNPIDACYEMIIRLHELKML